jgi:tetratricopeptide (TPR) repeat protein
MPLDLRKTKTELYYYSENGVVFGPFELSQLLDRIQPETLVHRFGIDWVMAKDVDELKRYFGHTIQSSIQPPKKSKFPAALIYISVGLCLILVLVLFFNRGSSASSIIEEPQPLDSSLIANNSNPPFTEANIYNSEAVSIFLSRPISSEDKLKAENSFNSAIKLYRVDHDPQSAIYFLKESILLHPKAQSFYELGNALLDIKQYAEAVKSYHVAENLNYQPYSRILYNLACVYSLLGQENESLSYLEKAIQNGYDNLNHMMSDKDLEFVRNSSRFSEITGITTNRAEFLLGTWVGEMSGDKFTLAITQVDGENISGFNILKSNKRPVNGSFKEITTNEFCSRAFHVVLNEPGDDNWDGVFEINYTLYFKTISLNGVTTCQYDQFDVRCTGTWKSNNGKLKHEFELNKK